MSKWGEENSRESGDACAGEVDLRRMNEELRGGLDYTHCAAAAFIYDPVPHVSVCVCM